MIRERIPSSTQLGDAPWWAWIGGAFGAFYIVAAILLLPRLGATASEPTVIESESNPVTDNPSLEPSITERPKPAVPPPIGETIEEFVARELKKFQDEHPGYRYTK
jgi:hypothetical protein